MRERRRILPPRDVLGQIDGRHAALTEFGLDDVAVDQGGAEFFGDVLQRALDLGDGVL